MHLLFRRRVVVALVVVAILAGGVWVQSNDGNQNATRAAFDQTSTSSSTALPTTTTPPTSTDPSGGSSAAATGTDDDPIVAQKVREDLASGPTAPVIVSFTNAIDGTDEQRASAVDSLIQEMIAALPAGSWSELGQSGTTGSVALTITSAALDVLEKLNNVAVVESNRHDIKPLAGGSATSSTIGVQSLNSTTAMGADLAWGAGIKGAGATVAVLDTGVDNAHPYLTRSGTSKVVGEACFAAGGGGYLSSCPGGISMSVNDAPVPDSGNPCPVAECDHGTHVAGIAAGGDGISLPSGVAPSADLISIQVFVYQISGDVGADTSSINNGLQWLYNKRALFPDLTAVNLSLGDGQLYPGNCDSDSPSTKGKIDQLRAVGVYTVVASGNEGRTNGVSWPACISTSVAVGALDDVTGNTTLFSNYGPQVAVMAPGLSICSSLPDLHDPVIACPGPGGQMGYLSGTSMAAPAVLGELALLKGNGVASAEWTDRIQRTASGETCTNASGYAIPRARVDVALGLTARSLLPCAPSAIVGVAGSSSVAVSWTAPISDGGSAITGYTATVYTAAGVAVSSAETCSPSPATALSCTVGGLLNGTAYTFKVVATNAAGPGAASAASASVVPYTIPGAPTAVLGVAGNASVAVSWTAPISDGGSAITGYTATAYTAAGVAISPARTCSPSPATALSCTVGGLLNGTAYTFRVVARNTAGAGAVSAASASVTPFGYVPVGPFRIMDTRPISDGGSTIDGVGLATGPIGQTEVRRLRVAGRAELPSSGVTAVAINVTVVSPTAAGYLTVYPDGAPEPGSSNLNFSAGQVIANMAVTKVSVGGYLSFYNSLGSSNVVVDIVGWYTNSSGYNSIEPLRFLDTRSSAQGGGPTFDGQYAGIGGIGAGSTLDLQITGRIPTSGGTVVLNVTSTQSTAGGFLTVFPAGVARPTASNLNFVSGETIPNMVIAKVGAGGKISIYNLTGLSQVIVDVVGWYPPGSGYTALTPARLLDTRPPAQDGGPTVDGQFAGTGPIGGGATRNLTVTGRGGVPSTGVSVVALNVTSTGSTAGGYLTVFPAGATQPTASNINFVGGQTIPNMVLAKVGAGGAITLFNFSGSTNVVVDVVGWFP